MSKSNKMIYTALAIVAAGFLVVYARYPVGQDLAKRDSNAGVASPGRSVAVEID